MKLFLTEDQIHQIMELAKESPRDFALIHLMAATGFRASDVSNLMIDDIVDGDGEVVRQIRIRVQKTGDWIERPLREDCRAAIARYLASGDRWCEKFLFCPESRNYRWYGKDMPLDRRAIHAIIKGYLARLFPASILARAGAHTLRRSVAKLISDKTGRIEPASKFLGHKSVASTAAYIDIDGMEQRANKTILEDINW